MKTNNKQIWLEIGYQMIAEHGFTKVNVESIGRSIGKNKSSFYHYFGDWKGYVEALLHYHLSRAEDFALKINNCETIIPGMVEIFLDYKIDIFFHKQLRINRQNPLYAQCFESVYSLFETAIVEKWKSFLMLENRTFLATKILALISENFLLKITHTSYDYDWLHTYLFDVAKLINDIHSNSAE
ncbi:MAG: TetR/AcrR family transcriptional regulator [Saprospiraceae bacterium]|nr:TetR/AcrR family transcriptional regulator [Saprospiraceae bacterium]